MTDEANVGFVEDDSEIIETGKSFFEYINIPLMGLFIYPRLDGDSTDNNEDISSFWTNSPIGKLDSKFSSIPDYEISTTGQLH